MMSDGTELGMTKDSALGWLADESPSNGGAIIQFSTTTPPAIGGNWVSGTTAFVRGASYEGGILVKLYLYTFKSLSGSGIIHVGWTGDVTKATKFQATLVAGSRRVSLHAEVGGGHYGVRLWKGILEVDTSPLRLPFACQFERVEYLPSTITVP